MKPGWIERPTLNIDADRNPGARYSGLHADSVRANQALLRQVVLQMPPEATHLAGKVNANTANRFHEESVALAALHGAKWPEVLIGNVSNDFFIAMGCTTVALAGPDGPVVARNMDWPMEHLLARASYVLRYNKGGRLAYQHAGFAASIGVVTGVSENGFCLAVNAAAAPEPTNMDGYPVLLFLRAVLEDATSFKAALKMVTEQPLTVGAMITLVGSNNDERVVIERAPTSAALRWAVRNEPLVTTNYYQALPSNDVDEALNSGWKCSRLERMCALLNGFSLEKSTAADADQKLLGMLADEQVRQEITAQHIIMRPRARQMRLFVPDHLV